MEKLVEKIKEAAPKHASIPFWSWNDKLECDELRRQIRNMHDMKMQGFFMHARSGLETEYLSDEWYECISACIDEAKKLGMQAWSYDENGWPSGFAGGKLLEDPDNFAVFLDYEWLTEYPDKLPEDTLAVYATASCGRPKRVFEASGAEKYLRVFIGADSSYVDTMRADVTDKFIAATHEEYKQRLGAEFGGAMPGFFTDEPQYYRWKTPYSRHMEKWFFEEYGYSVIDAVPALFCDYEGAREHRYDYHRLITKKFTENFSKRLYDWHDKNGVKLTGHFVQEDTLAGQMMCCGDIMPQYLYEHIPGVDYLGRRLIGDLAFKQLGSVAAQTGKRVAMSEMFAACGWDVSPRELRRIAELQYAGGVNLTCQHLYPYSIRGQRKRDYPAFYSEHNPWQSDLAIFNEYFNNLGSALSLGVEYADILVIHPMHTAWLDFKRCDMDASVALHDKNLASLVKLLSSRGVAYHFGSEAIMKDMASVTGALIRVGECSYKTVIIPAADTLDASTVALLEKFREGGGKIYTYLHHLPSRIDGKVAEIGVLSGLRDLTDSGVLSEIVSSSDVVLNSREGAYLRTMTRITENGRLVYITNLGDTDERVELLLRGAASLGVIDIATLSTRAVTGKSCELGAIAEMSIPSGESILLFDKGAPDMIAGKNDEKYVKLCKKPTVSAIFDNYLTLDRAYISKDGGEYSELLPIEKIRDDLIYEGYLGRITLAFPFTVCDIPERLELLAEKLSGVTVRVNGALAEFSASAIDRSISLADISSLVRVGENLVELSLDYYQRDYVRYVIHGGVTEALRNCLLFDTELEAVYLRGSFALDAKGENFIPDTKEYCRYPSESGFAIIAPTMDINPENIVTSGYPFFAGELTLSTTLDYKLGDPTVLRLTGRYATAKIKVNGAVAGSLILSERIDLAPYLKEGENTLEIILKNGLRNLFGPHHNTDAEVNMLCPRHFTFEGKWKLGTPCDFDPRYSFVRFGIDL